MQKKIGVIGSSGAMGFGIVQLLMQKIELWDSLVLIDLLPKKDWKKALRTFAEKNINALRHKFPQLISNREVIDYFLALISEKVIFSNDIRLIDRCELVFEAVTESLETKVALLKRAGEGILLSNTSSIPIHQLCQKSGKKVLGFHFYNPPQKNKMCELVGDDRDFLADLATTLDRVFVFSKDVPGFIGNGYFMRELRFAFELVEEGYHPGYIDWFTRVKLQRPLGIFQLAHFIGKETVFHISQVMGFSLPTLPSNRETEEGVDLWDRYEEVSQAIAHTLQKLEVIASIEDLRTVLKVGFGFKHVSF